MTKRMNETEEKNAETYTLLKMQLVIVFFFFFSSALQHEFIGCSRMKEEKKKTTEKFTNIQMNWLVAISGRLSMICDECTG